MSKYIIATNTGGYWNVRGDRANAEATLDWLMHVGYVTEDDEAEIIDIEEDKEETT